MLRKYSFATAALQKQSLKITLSHTPPFIWTRKPVAILLHHFSWFLNINSLQSQHTLSPVDCDVAYLKCRLCGISSDWVRVVRFVEHLPRLLTNRSPILTKPTRTFRRCVYQVSNHYRLCYEAFHRRAMLPERRCSVFRMSEIPR